MATGIEGLAGLSEWVIWIIIAVVVLSVWSAIWKGIALWKSGRNNQIVWFIVLFLIGTAGILEIIYLLFFQRKRK